MLTSWLVPILVNLTSLSAPPHCKRFLKDSAQKTELETLSRKAYYVSIYSGLSRFLTFIDTTGKAVIKSPLVIKLHESPYTIIVVLFISFLFQVMRIVGARLSWLGCHNSQILWLRKVSFNVLKSQTSIVSSSDFLRNLFSSLRSWTSACTNSTELSVGLTRNCVETLHRWTPTELYLFGYTPTTELYLCSSVVPTEFLVSPAKLPRVFL